MFFVPISPRPKMLVVRLNKSCATTVLQVNNTNDLIVVLFVLFVQVQGNRVVGGGKGR